MELEYVGNSLADTIKQEIWEILCECDGEFFPPLSSRNSTSQNRLSDNAGRENEPRSYFDEMIRQNFILSVIDGRVAGFMSFIKAYSCPALESFGESLYITTVCVKHDRRGKGLLSAMYEEMENSVAEKLGCPRISTRTWSQNLRQIHVLNKLGYRAVATIKNDRGEGIDTIYFGKDTGLPGIPRKN